MLHSDKAFRAVGLLSALLALSVYEFRLMYRVPYVGVPAIGELLQKEGLVGWVALLVLWLSLWALLALIVRWWRVRIERTFIKLAHRAAEGGRGGDHLEEYMQRSLDEVWRQLYAKSQLHQRLRLWEERMHDFNRSDRLSFLMMGQSSVDCARMETAYGPLRALVWALPGLGFMGTALEMSNAIKGMEGVSNTSTENLLSALMQKVIPSLGGAFQITLFALGSSVLCFLLLSLVHRQEEEVLHNADALTLRLLSEVDDERPELLMSDDTSRYLATGLRDLRTVLQLLKWELEKINAVAPRPTDDGRFV